MHARFIVIASVVLLVPIGSGARANAETNQYVWGKAHHILPETTSEESGYFSLCEGLNGRIYVGTARYGSNAYLVEFDPKTEKQRIVVDAKKVTRDPGAGYASQSKIHTRNSVAPSGTIYVGTKQGYPSREEREKCDIPPYRGGYVITYDPKTDKARSLGIPWPGFGVIDTVADEARGLIYVVTCEDPYAWMVYDEKPKRYRWLGPELAPFATTIIDARGRANTITWDFKLVRYDPETNTLTRQDIIVDGRDKLSRLKEERNRIPYWTLAADGKTAYFAIMQDNKLYRLDLGGDAKGPVALTTLGEMVQGAEATDTRSGITLAPDGRVYLLVKARYAQPGGALRLHHLVRYDPKANQLENLGVLAVKNPDFFKFAPGPDGKKPPHSHGYQTLPDDTLTPLHNHMALIAAHDGTLYATILYPYTLLRIEPTELR